VAGRPTDLDRGGRLTARFDLVVLGGTVVRASGSLRADVGITGGRIAAVEPGIPADAGNRSIEATGLLVLPGVIDVHTHTRIPSATEPDRFYQDSMAAALGGTTTFLSFNNPGTGISERAQRRLRDGIGEWLDRTSTEPAVDYGLSAVITAQQEDPVADLAWALEHGVPSFKCFLVYDFGVDEAQLRELLAASGRLGALLEVHGEDRALLEHGVADQLAAGHTGPEGHAASRPPECEATGTGRVIEIAAEVGAPVYLVHVSCEAAVDRIADARSRGQPVFGETCPHYLALDASRYQLPPEHAIRAVISPPLRDASDQASLWDALARGFLDLVATDHVPDRLAIEKRWTGQPFTAISNGGPGIETLLSVVYSAGVAGGRIAVERMVDLLATTPARIFGLPAKGSVEVGRDADLVVFDPSARRTIRQSDLHHTSDFTPYEGMEVSGAVRDVLVRGELAVRDGVFVGRRGFGRFVERQPATSVPAMSG
jgi:dihydropyrimidinase